MIERVELFDTQELRYLFLAFALFFLLNIANEYRNYRELTRFDDALIEARITNHYVKKKREKSYSVLRFRYKGANFFTVASPYLKNLLGRDVSLQLFTDTLTFYDYLRGGFIRSQLLGVSPNLALHVRVAKLLAKRHEDKIAGELYGALFFATPISKDIRAKLSALGLSHLLAISGFHLGVLAFIVAFLLRPLYTRIQQRYAPYRHGNRDIAFFTFAALFCYLLLIGDSASFLRAFAMAVVGFVLYDRGIKIVSFTTLSLTSLLLLSLFPRLLFSIGFWLSVAGVFYIFLLLYHWKIRDRIVASVAIAVWLYFTMLPFSLYLFANFTLAHPLSVLFSLLFILFYPLAIVAHLLGIGDIFDLPLYSYIATVEPLHVTLPLYVVAAHIALSLAAIRYKRALFLDAGLVVAIFVAAVYQITEF